MPRILLIASQASYHTEYFQAACARLGVELAVASDGLYPIVPCNSVGLKFNFEDHPSCLALAEQFDKESPLDGVVGVDDSTVELAALVATRLGLPTNTAKATRISQRKDDARRIQRAFGLQSPNFISLELGGPNKTLVPEGIDFPCVAKPVSLSASRGVIRANNPAELKAAFKRISRILDSYGPLHPRRVIVEDYISGEEYAVEGLLYRGKWRVLAIFGKPEPLEGPYFEETIYITPPPLKPAVKSAINTAVEETCRAYGLFHGPVHAECRVNSEGVWLIELAPRTIGGRCARMLQFSTGHTLAEIVSLNAIGKTIQCETGRGVTGVMMIPVPEAGVLRRIEGIEAARQTRHVDAVEIDTRPGQILIPWPEGSSYPGFIFAHALTAKNVIDALHAAHRELEFVVSSELPLVTRTCGNY